MTTRRRQQWIGRAIASIAACLMITLTGCDPNGPAEANNMDQATQEFNELMKRPDIDQAVASYQQMYTTIRDQLSAAFPGMTWDQTLEPSPAACESGFTAVDADQPQNDAVTTTLGNWNTNVAITDAQWLMASATATAVTQRYGFSSPKVLVDRPGIHGLQFEDRYQAVLTFNVGRVAGLTFVTGCHLTAAAKRRGRPGSPPAY